ncbi:MAG TPA: hypothetical protein VN450_05995 [Candidatus Methylomirabilis sp.]|nr:hypothetical protein [Candidatus Methylomirabilis sp.]
MNTLRFFWIGVLLWIAAAGAALAAGEPGPGAGGGPPPTQHTFVCPDLASTELFRSKGLGYVHTLEFAEAVATVARGASPFAPQPVPPEWNSVAGQWYLHLAAHDAEASAGHPPPVQWKRFSADEEPCDPVLLHKASLEYRARHGNAGVVYPYFVKIGAVELEERVGHIDDLSDRVASKIGMAERMGALQCSPSDVARAEKALESALRIAAAHHYDPDYAERPFLAAERLADDLVESRRFATSRGLVCFSSQ